MADISTMEDLGNFLASTSKPSSDTGLSSTASPIGSVPAVPASAPPQSSTGVASAAIQGQPSPTVTTVPAITAAQSAGTQDPTVDKQPADRPNQLVPAQPGTATPPSSVNQVTDLFNIAPTLKGDYSKVDQFNQQYIAAVGDTVNELTKITPLREKAASDLAATRTEVAQNIVGASKVYGDKTQQFDQQREALAARQMEIVTGNPFVMFFKGIMDKNYRPDYLAEKTAALNLQGQSAAQTYQDILKTNTERATAAQTAYEGVTNALNTEQEGVEAKAKLLGATAQGYSKIAADHAAQVSVAQELQVAQHTAQTNMLDSLTPQDTNKYYGQAKASPDGTVTVNGVKLTAGQLLATSQGWESKNLSLRQQHNAVTLGDINTADATQKQWADRASMPELLAAQASNKLPNGMPVNHAIIGDAIVGNQTANQNAVAAIRQQGVAPLYQSGLYSLATVNASSEQNEAQLFGRPSAEHDAYSHRLALALTNIGDSVRKANAVSPEAGQIAMTNATEQLAKLRAEHDLIVKRDAERFGGTDKDIAAWGESYLNNQFLDAPTAVRAVIKTYRNGGSLPGLNTPSAVAMMSRVGRLIDAYDNPTTSAANPLLGDQRKKEKNDGFVSAELAQQVGHEMNSQHVGDSLNNMAAASTMVARNVKMPDGSPHPAASIDPQLLYHANQGGTDAAMRWMATSLGLTESQAKDVKAKGESSIYWQNFAHGHPKGMTLDSQQYPTNYSTFMGAFQSHEAQGMLSILGPQAADYVDLWHNPDFQKNMIQSSSMSKNLSAGDYAIHAVAGTQVPSGIINYDQRLQNAWGALNKAGVNQRLATLNAFRAVTPVDSARLTLYTDPKIRGHEADALMQFITPRAQALAQQQNIPLADAIDSLMKQKLPDPALERIRKVASADWDIRRKATDDGINNWVDVRETKLGSTPQQQLEHQLENQPNMTLPMGGR